MNEDYDGTFEDDDEDAEIRPADPERDYKHTAARADMDDGRPAPASSSAGSTSKTSCGFHGEVEWVAKGAADPDVDLLPEFNKAISKKARDEDQTTFWACASSASSSSASTSSAARRKPTTPPSARADDGGNDGYDSDDNANSIIDGEEHDAMPIAIPSFSDLKNLPVTAGPIEVSHGPLPERLRLGQLYSCRNLALIAVRGVAATTGNSCPHPALSSSNSMLALRVVISQHSSLSIPPSCFYPPPPLASLVNPSYSGCSPTSVCTNDQDSVHHLPAMFAAPCRIVEVECSSKTCFRIYHDQRSLLPG